LKGGQGKGGEKESSEQGKSWKEDRERGVKRRAVNKDKAERSAGRGGQ
jgi:hypothetical protein